MSIDKSKDIQFFVREARPLPEGANKTLISPSDISLLESQDVKTYLSLFHHNLRMLLSMLEANMKQLSHLNC